MITTLYFTVVLSEHAKEVLGGWSKFGPKDLPMQWHRQEQ
jgi:hypothetical protein